MTSLSFSVFDKVDARNDVDVGVNVGVDVGVDDVETRVRREKLVRQEANSPELVSHGNGTTWRELELVKLKGLRKSN